MLPEFRPLRIFVTGVSGQLGGVTASRLASRGHEVVGCFHSHRVSISNVRCVGTDSLDRSLGEFDIILHTATSYGREGESSEQLLEANVLFPRQVCEALAFSGVFINIDTALPAGLTAYSRTKSVFREWLQAGTMRAVNVKLEHMYGPNDHPRKLVGRLIAALKRKEPAIELTDGKQLRDFVYIDDITSALVRIVETSRVNSSWFETGLGSGQLVSVRTMIETFFEQARNMGFSQTPDLLFGAIARRAGEPDEISVDIAPLLELGWAPEVQLRDGLVRTLKSHFSPAGIDR